MSALLCFVITFLALTVALANGNSAKIPEFIKSMKCSDCSMNKDCAIKSTGFYCPRDVDRVEIHYNPDGNISTGLGYLANCMAQHYYFYNKKSISHVCCFWSPLIGCRQVRNLEAQSAPCGTCANWNWSPNDHHVGCPCQEKEDTKRKKKKGKNSSTKLTHSGIVPTIFLHFVQQMICQQLLLKQ
ncbi:uncharacterized protein LOC117585093 [Drosophila guanche]|uniref:uncharacterized protein LOC117585093 n=1 Tax=Drosophila guanche TaxID=7266 RepID=UPI0014720616|nr:uncharacterized protein LOC117585093 [Drosophila guanche]